MKRVRFCDALFCKAFYSNAFYSKASFSKTFLCKIILFSLLTLSIFPTVAFSLGFGEIKLFSYLNQPLDAEIDLLGAENFDPERLMVTLASAQEFKRAGLERPFFLSQLRFEVQRSSTRTFIKISTKEPIKQPYLDFLIDLSWAGGRLVRGYTLLLDPAPTQGHGSDMHDKRGQNESTYEPRAVVLSASHADSGKTPKQALENLFEEDNKNTSDSFPPPMTVVSKTSAKASEFSQKGEGTVLSLQSQPGQSGAQNGSQNGDSKKSLLMPPVTLTSPTPSFTPESVLQIRLSLKHILLAGGGTVLFFGLLYGLVYYLKRRKTGELLRYQSAHPAISNPLPPGYAPMQPNPISTAAFQSTSMQSNPMQFASMQSAPMQAAPMQSHATHSMQINPMQANPMQSTPIQSNQMQNNPMHAHSMPSFSTSHQSMNPSAPTSPSVSPTNPATLMTANLLMAQAQQGVSNLQFGKDPLSSSHFPHSGFPFSSETSKPFTFQSEVALKIELVRNYLDMGDTENALPLLENILMEGNEQEKEQAQKMLFDLKGDKLDIV